MPSAVQLLPARGRELFTAAHSCLPVVHQHLLVLAGGGLPDARQRSHDIPLLDRGP